jgi:hypothetical protein
MMIKGEGRESRSMSELSERFRERVARGDLRQDVQVVYLISGGMPEERIEEEFRLSGGSEAESRFVDERTAEAAREVSAQLDSAETQQLFQRVASSLDALVSRSEARFLPDSSIGSITIEVGGEQETLYFLADEGQRQGQEEASAPRMPEALKPLEETSRRLLAERGEEGHERPEP